MAPALWPREEGKQIPSSGDIQEGLVLEQPDLNLRSYPYNPEAVREGTAQMLADKLAWHHLGEVSQEGGGGAATPGAAAPPACSRAWRAKPRPREAATGARPGAPAGGVPPLLWS